MKKNTEFKTVTMNGVSKEIPTSWKVFKLKDLFYVKIGEVILEKHLEKNGKIPVYSAKKSEKIYGYVNKTNRLLRKNLDMILIARGTNIGYITIPREDSCSTQTTLSLVSITNNIDITNYVYMFLKKYKELVFRDVDGGAIKQISLKDVENIDIPMPTDTKEISKIVQPLIKQEELLQMLDRQIQLEHKKMNFLQSNLLTGEIIF